MAKQPSIISLTISSLNKANDVIFHIVDTEDANFFVDKSKIVFGKGLEIEKVEKLTGKERNRLRDILTSSLTSGFTLVDFRVNNDVYACLSFNLSTVISTLVFNRDYKSTDLSLIKFLDPKNSVLTLYCPMGTMDIDIKDNMLKTTNLNCWELISLLGVRNVLILVVLILGLVASVVPDREMVENLIDRIEHILPTVIDDGH